MPFSKNLYVNREDAIRIVTQEAPQIMKVFKQNLTSGTIKQDHTFVCITGGSGAGKTRAATEVTRTLSTVI
jgi:adenylylsulfate kinase-like enzyme